MKTIQFKHGANHNIRVANHYLITTDNGTYFKSYNSVVCFIPKDKRKCIQFGIDWDYSRTTTSHLYEFLRDNGIRVFGKNDVKTLRKAKFLTRNVPIE